MQDFFAIRRILKDRAEQGNYRTHEIKAGSG